MRVVQRGMDLKHSWRTNAGLQQLSLTFHRDSAANSARIFLAQAQSNLPSLVLLPIGPVCTNTIHKHNHMHTQDYRHAHGHNCTSQGSLSRAEPLPPQRHRSPSGSVLQSTDLAKRTQISSPWVKKTPGAQLGHLPSCAKPHENQH